MSETNILKEISLKLDALISLYKIGLKKELNILTEEIKKDKVSQKILEMADGSLSSGELRQKVADSIGVSEVTVRRRISELSEMGLLLSRRENLNVYYTNSGIIEV